MREYQLSEYLDMDIDILTLDDAKDNAEWMKKHGIPSDYIGISKVCFRRLHNATMEQKAQLWDLLESFLIDGAEPEDLESLPYKVATGFDIASTDHINRVGTKALGEYKKFVGAKKAAARRAEAAAQREDGSF